MNKAIKNKPLQGLGLKFQNLKIGEISDQMGISRDTLRYYEKEGLIKPSLRSAAGYRLYSEADQACLKFVLSSRQVGFSLKDIADLLAIKINKKAKSCQDVKTMTANKIVQVDEKLAELQKLKSALNKLHDSCCGGPENAEHCSILQALEGGNV